ncbi:MAG: hypothetical protein K9L75_06370, partial [Spirochaetia bacterium]|nr:hypothetical protein [Spirochaetia bacterium]
MKEKFSKEKKNRKKQNDENFTENSPSSKQGESTGSQANSSAQGAPYTQNSVDISTAELLQKGFSDEFTDEEFLEAQKIAEDAEGGTRHVTEGWTKWIVPVIAVSWSIFQMLIASVLLLDSTIIRSIHLAFAITLV